MTEDELREAAQKIQDLCVDLGVTLWACSCCDNINMWPKGEIGRGVPSLAELRFNDQQDEQTE